QLLNRSPQPVFRPLAARAITWLGVSATLAALTYALSYYRNMRRIVEEPDIVPAERSHAPARWLRWGVNRCWRNPLDRAVLLFIARTLTRSRQHRNLMAAFGGLALAISLAMAKGLIYGNSQLYELARRYGFQPPRWNQPNIPMMAAGFVLLT